MTIPKRDIRKDYERAYVARHAALVTGGNTEEAEKVAAILKDHYGVDVAKTNESADAVETGDSGANLENASDKTPNEDTSARTTTVAKKTTAAKPSASK